MNLRERFRSEGFALIELGAVIAVTALIVTLVYSAFRTHTVRSEVEQGIAQVENLKLDIVREFLARGQPPASVDEISNHATVAMHPYLSNVSVEDGRIDLTYGDFADPAIAARHLSLTPYETAELQIVWLCGNKVPGRGLKPLGFAGGGVQSAHRESTIEARFLPRSCR